MFMYEKSIDMKNRHESLYDPKFYERQIEGSIRSAKVILASLFKDWVPSSVIDFGCGHGGWLSVAHDLGSKKVVGLDGYWVSQDDLVDSEIEFVPVDFDKIIEVSERFELAMSMEVAEHLPYSKADSFVEALCSSADVVLFSAAIVCQGGTNHINEQPQSYWVNKFSQLGYECFDPFRSDIWDDERVEVWYRQNILLFISRSSNNVGLSELKKKKPAIVDLVHPLLLKEKEVGWKEIVQNKNERIDQPSPKFILASIWKLIFRRWTIESNQSKN